MRNVARHEAGHALVATVVGYLPIMKVEIWRRPSSYVWSGAVEFESSERDWASASEEDLAEAAMVAIAGALAIDPTLRATRLADRMCPSDWGAFSYAMFRLADEETEDVVFDRVAEKSATILQDNCSRLDALARRICRKKCLDGEEVTRVLGEVQNLIR
jgi:hypothetical protein